MNNNDSLTENFIFPALSNLPQVADFNALSHLEGTNRCAQEDCQIAAQNDAQAVQCWLREYEEKTTTFRSYQKEAERLLLWCLYQQKKPLSGLRREDFEAYFLFLANPSPKEQWCSGNAPRGSRLCKRGSPHWRPFVGPLSRSAQQTATTIINSLMDYLVEARYLQFNPLRLMRKKNKHASNTEMQQLRVWERILEEDEWTALWETLLEMPEDTPELLRDKERLRFIVVILYFLGLRIHELATHQWNAFRKIRGAWWFFVKGKGDKLGKIPVNDTLLSAICRFRAHLGLPSFPQAEDCFPLIPSWRSEAGLGVRHINQLLKKLAINTAVKFTTQPDKAEKLKKFSAHWLRHLSATMQDQAGVLFKHIQANHRHESEETTRRYVHTFDQDRHADMQKLKLPLT
jgi:integrase